MKAANSGGSIDIFGDIGGYGVNFQSFARQLESLGLGAGDELNIRISSDGGDVYQGFAIYQILALHPANKIITVMGLAASMASVIFMAGDERIMPANATLMIHNPVGQIVGESEEIVAFGEGVAKMKSNIAQAYSDATGGKLTVQRATALMNRQSWLGADEALTLGLATEVIGAAKIAAKFDLSRYPNVPANVAASIQRKERPMPKSKNQREEFDFEGTNGQHASRDTVRAEVIAQQTEITNLCALAGQPALAAKFVEDDLTVSEVVAELTTIKAGGKSDYVKVGAAATKKASGRMTASERTAERDLQRRGGDEVSARQNLNAERAETGVAAVLDPTAIWNKWNGAGTAKAA